MYSVPVLLDLQTLLLAPVPITGRVDCAALRASHGCRRTWGSPNTVTVSHCSRTALSPWLALSHRTSLGQHLGSHPLHGQAWGAIIDVWFMFMIIHGTLGGGSVVMRAVLTASAEPPNLPSTLPPNCQDSRRQRNCRADCSSCTGPVSSTTGPLLLHIQCP